MPESNGEALVRTFRQCPEMDSTSVILITAKANDYSDWPRI